MHVTLQQTMIIDGVSYPASAWLLPYVITETIGASASTITFNSGTDLNISETAPVSLSIDAPDSVSLAGSFDLSCTQDGQPLLTSKPGNVAQATVLTGTVTIACTASLTVTSLPLTITKRLIVEGADVATGVPGTAVFDVGDSVDDGVTPVVVDGQLLMTGQGIAVDDTTTAHVVPTAGATLYLSERQSDTDGVSLVGHDCGDGLSGALLATFPPAKDPVPLACTFVNQIDAASFTVTKLLEGAPAAWPISATITGDGLGATVFSANGTTSLTQTTDATTGEATYALDHVSSGEALLAITLTEPRRSDGSLASIQCSNIGGDDVTFTASVFEDDKGWIDEPTRVGGTVFVPAFWIDGLSCTMANDAPAVLTLTKHLDGGETPVAGFDLIAAPIDNGITVGTGTTFDDDGVFPSASTPTDVNVVFSSAAVQTEGPSYLFVGERLRPGFMLTGIDCAQIGERRGPSLSVDATYLLQGEDEVGRVVGINAWETAACDIENASAAISATKTASVQNPAPGQAYTYTITATNSGHTPLLGAVLTDPLPAGLTVSSAVTSSGSCTTTATQVDCSLGDMAMGASRTITVGVTLAASATDGTDLTNVATISADVPAWDPALDVQLFETQQPALAATSFTTKVTATASARVAVVVPTTTTTTTTAPTTAPTTTAAPTTTVAVAQEAPTTTTTAAVIPVVSPTTLPRTGGGIDLLPAALGTSAVGALLLAVHRLRRRAA